MCAMTRQKNPYRPGAAVSPLHLAGRQKEIRRFENTLGAAPELPANVKMTGLRGVGKSVLLKEFERRAAEDLGWLTSRVQIEPSHNQDDTLTRVVRNATQKAISSASRTALVKSKVAGAVSAARGLIKVSYNDIDFSLGGSGEPGVAPVAKALYEAAETADATGHEGYVLMLDEAQILRDDKEASGEHPLSLLVAAVNTLQEQELPIALVLCGLPTLKANLLKARTYSERMCRGEEIARLDGPPANDAAEAFVKPLDGTGMTATDGLVERVVEECEGYPYFIQLWGAELWDAAIAAGLTELTEALLDQVEPDIYQRLDNDFYETRVESLTPAEQDILMATAECHYPPLKTSDLRTKSKKTDANVNVLMGRLDSAGVIYRVQKGTYEYTAPKFHGYLQRRAKRLAAMGR